MLSIKHHRRRSLDQNPPRPCRLTKTQRRLAGQSDPDYFTADEGTTGDNLFDAHRRRIVVGMDFSAASDDACRFAVKLALASDALIDLVHVFDVFTETFVNENQGVLDRAESLMSEIDGALVRRQRLAEFLGARVVHTRLVGAPGLEIAIHAARTQTALIVLGDGGETRGPHGWTWGRRVAEQIANSARWRGVVLLRSSSGSAVR